MAREFFEIRENLNENIISCIREIVIVFWWTDYRNTFICCNHQIIGDMNNKKLFYILFTGYFRDRGCNMRNIFFLRPEYYKYKIMQNMDFVEFLVKCIDILTQHFDYH